MGTENHRLNGKDKLILAAVGFLQIGLIAAKIGGTIPWHWMLVLLPTELIMGLFVLVIVVAGFKVLMED